MSSTRLMNSGRKCSLTIFHHRRLHLLVVLLARQLPGSSLEPRLDVMTMTVLRKSTVRPWPSVSRPSSSTCSSTLKTSGMRLLDLVEQNHRVGLAAHRFGEITALLVADVARRRADHAADRVLLHELRHVEAHQRLFGIEQKRRQRLAQFRLADTGRPEKQERAVRPVRIRKPRAAAANRIGHGASRPRPGRPRARESPLPCAAASRARPRASSTPGCPSTWRRPRPLPPR